MDENYIKIEFTHEQKGLITTSSFTERSFYFLDGFSSDTLAAEQERYINDTKKALNYIEKASISNHVILDLYMNESLSYRIITDYENNEKGLYILTFQKSFSHYTNKEKTTKKDILRLIKAFYIESIMNTTKTA